MYLSESEKQAITQAIHQAELQTSGEIKVHIEDYCPEEDPIERAKVLFHYLSLHHTALRNGVLFYISVMDRKFAILGDEGIHKAAGDNLWKEEYSILKGNLSEGETVNGICMAITRAGQALKQYFPYQSGDVNEISNDISFG